MMMITFRLMTDLIHSTIITTNIDLFDDYGTSYLLVYLYVCLLISTTLSSESFQQQTAQQQLSVYIIDAGAAVGNSREGAIGPPSISLKSSKQNMHGASRGYRMGCSIRIPLAVRPKETHFYRNAVFLKSRSIMSRNCAVQLSTVPGSSLLWFHDPWHRWSKRQILFKPLSTDYDSQSTSSCRWITSSPISPTFPQSLLHRMIWWLQKWWQRISRFFFVTIRTTEVILRLSPLIILTPAAAFSTRVLGSPMLSNMAWNYTIIAIQGLGPVAIKFCQWAATRRDIFSPTLCDRLSILHDKGYPHSWRWTRQVLTEAFGDYEGKGLRVEGVIGSGAAAQVYRGKLTIKTDSINSSNYQSTREVAIKVLHPRFQELVDRDLDFIEIMADILHSLPIDYLKMLNLPRAVEDFSVVLRDQADLTIEAENLRQFRRNFYKDSQQTKERSSIVFPQPIDGWTSSHVIVEEYIDAAPIADFLLDSSQEGMDIRRELAGPLLRAFLKMVFIDNFIHGDLHPVRITYLGLERVSGVDFISRHTLSHHGSLHYLFCTLFIRIVHD